jgi:serine/threonine protein kinase
MNIENGAIINQYKIISSIGKGGMGEVYLAEDTKLNRKVAIKFLNEEFSQDADKLNRFIQEAKAASALNHPNILSVYEIGESDGKNYIAAEFIKGRTLREKLSGQEPFQLNSILKIARERRERTRKRIQTRWTG